MSQAPDSDALRACLPAGLLALALLGLAGHELQSRDLQIELVSLAWLLFPFLAAPLLVRVARVSSPGRWACCLALGGVLLAALETEPSWSAAVVVSGLLAWGTQAPRASVESVSFAVRSVASLLAFAGCVLAACALGRDVRPVAALLPLLALLAALGFGVWRASGGLVRLGGFASWAVLGASCVPLLRELWTPGWVLAAFVLPAALLRVGRTCDPFRRRRVLWTCTEYAAWICLPLALWGVRAASPRPPTVEPNMTGELPHRLAYYAEHRDAFDLVFVGDSRTFCGIHPEIMDPLLGTHSINLALAAHWLPTQYPFMRDLLQTLKPGTTVVLSVGPINFLRVGDAIQTGYPLSWRDAADYLTLGFSFGELRPNLVQHSLIGPALAPLAATAGELRLACDAFASTPLLTLTQNAPPGTLAPEAEGDPYADLAQRLLADFEGDPEHASVSVLSRNGRSTALEVFGARGGNRFIELDRAYFRARQTPRSAGPPFVADPAHLGLFEKLLELCQKAKVRLIVNAIREAPHTYGGNRFEVERRFMRETVQPLVEERGFAYVEADFTGIRDEHYLDYNHLNQDGVALYAPRLAAELRPHLPPRGK